MAEQRVLAPSILVRVQVPQHTYDYSYDWSGNRLTETLDIATRSFGYNAANQLISEGATTLTCDLNGNLLNDGANACV